MGDSTRDADADVIVSGREPRRRSQARPPGLAWLLVIVQAAALAVAAAVAVHYRAEAGRLDHSGAQPASPLASPIRAPDPSGRALRRTSASNAASNLVRLHPPSPP